MKQITDCFQRITFLPACIPESMAVLKADKSMKRRMLHHNANNAGYGHTVHKPGKELWITYIFDVCEGTDFLAVIQIADKFIGNQ